MEKHPPPSAIQWHSAHARAFDAAYHTDRRFRDRYQTWLTVISRYSQTGNQALDLGCGSGELLLPLARLNRRVVGIDGSPEMLRICQEKLNRTGLANVEVMQGDITRIAHLGLGRFDLIIASSVLEYVADLEGTIDRLRESLAPGGTFIFSLPNGSSLYRIAEPFLYRLLGRPTYYPHVVNVATAQQMRALLDVRGYRVLETHFLSPTPLLSTVLRPLGLRAFADNLMLFVCRRDNATP